MLEDIARTLFVSCAYFRLKFFKAKNGKIAQIMASIRRWQMSKKTLRRIEALKCVRCGSELWWITDDRFTCANRRCDKWYPRSQAHHTE